MKKVIFVDIVCCLYILLFLYTGLYKLLSMANFRGTIAKSPLIHRWASVVAPAIVIIELSIAALLIIPFFATRPLLRKWGLYGSAVLMTLFTVYIYYMLHFSSDTPCTCGGIIQEMTWHQHLYFNASFTLLALAASWLHVRQPSYYQTVNYKN